jgi:hypothetical protein
MARKPRDVDKGWDAFKKRIESNKGRSFTKVGLPTGSTPAVVPGEKNGNKPFLDLVQIGAVHEFGAPKRKIPERSWLRSTTDEEQKNIAKMMSILYPKVIAGKMPLKTALGQIGEYLAGKMKNKIRNKIPPENAPSTVARKKNKRHNDVPLIDTGQMVQSITHIEVIKGK